MENRGVGISKVEPAGVGGDAGEEGLSDFGVMGQRANLNRSRTTKLAAAACINEFDSAVDNWRSRGGR